MIQLKQKIDHNRIKFYVPLNNLVKDKSLNKFIEKLINIRKDFAIPLLEDILFVFNNNRIPQDLQCNSLDLERIIECPYYCVSINI